MAGAAVAAHTLRADPHAGVPAGGVGWGLQGGVGSDRVGWVRVGWGLKGGVGAGRVGWGGVGGGAVWWGGLRWGRLGWSGIFCSLEVHSCLIGLGAVCSCLQACVTGLGGSLFSLWQGSGSDGDSLAVFMLFNSQAGGPCPLPAPMGASGCLTP